MSKTVNTIQVAKRVLVTPNHVALVEGQDKTFKATKMINLSSAELKDETIKNALNLFYNTVTVEADTKELASDKLTQIARKTFVVKTTSNIDKVNEALKSVEEQAKNTKDKKQAEADKKKAEQNKKAEDKKNKDKEKAEEKPLVDFKFFVEYSTCKAYQLSPDNEKVVASAVQYFKLLNKAQIANEKLSADEEKILKNKDSIKSTMSLVNRDTIRLLITEVDKQNKLVAQYLLKPLYLNPLSIICVVEAHNKPNKTKSLYHDIINTDHEMTCYDVFQFSPLEKTLTTSTTTDNKSTNTVKFQFVNVKADERK